jgi:hypothetical protein
MSDTESSFSLIAIIAMPTIHDLTPEEIPIGFVGRVSETTLERVYDLRREAQRQSETKDIKVLQRIADDIEGWRQTVTVEMEGRA